MSWPIKLPFYSFALLYSVELSARGRGLCALVMCQTLPDHHNHYNNVKTDITRALHLGCRIYTCSLNIISQIVCIQQHNLCCHTSRVTCTLMSISNSDIINTSQLSSLIDIKTISVEERTTKACPNNDCQRHFIFEWLGKHLLTLHHKFSGYQHYNQTKRMWQHVNTSVAWQKCAYCVRVRINISVCLNRFV